MRICSLLSEVTGIALYERMAHIFANFIHQPLRSQVYRAPVGMNSCRLLAAFGEPCLVFAAGATPGSATLNRA